MDHIVKFEVREKAVIDTVSQYSKSDVQLRTEVTSKLCGEAGSLGLRQRIVPRPR